MGWFHFRYFVFFKAHDQSRPSIDPPRGCANIHIPASTLYHWRILQTAGLLFCLPHHSTVGSLFCLVVPLWPFAFLCTVGSWGCYFSIRFS